MAIYAEKRDGKPTGRWRVELQRAGERYRKRHDSYAAAKVDEGRVKALWAAGVDVERTTKRVDAHQGQAVTLAEGYKRAEPRLWRGLTYEATSLARLRKMIEVLGEDRAIESVNTEDVDTLKDHLSFTGAADATINRYMSALSTFLKFCQERGYRKTDLPNFSFADEGEGRIRWVTPDEERKLLELVPENIAKVIQVAIDTGMRRSEILTLERDQVEPEWVRLWKTKTKTPRSVPINEETYDRLVYLIESDAMPTISELRREWDKARKVMGLDSDPNFVFHACRHTCATRLVQANVNLRVIQKFLGHKTIQTTVRYAQVADEFLKEAVAKRDKHFGDRGPSVAHVD